VTTGDWFERLYAESYRGLMLTAYALLGDLDEAEAVTRDAFARARPGVDAEQVREVVVALARRRLRWRAVLDLVRRRPRADHDPVVVLRQLAGLPVGTIASIVDLPEAEVGSRLAAAGPGEAGASWASTRQPNVARVRVRARQRAVRRRMLATAAVAARVVGVAVPVLRAGNPPGPAPRAAAPSSTPPPSLPMVSGTTVYGVTFADLGHGYAMRATCGRYDCTLDVLSTVDREHWTARQVPKADTPPGTMGALSVLGPDEFTVDLFPPNQPGAVRRVYSGDGGRTWERTPTEPGGEVTEIPPGAALGSHCVGDRAGCRSTEVVVVLPGSGRSARLAGTPRLERAYAGQVPLASGQWWMSGLNPDTHRPQLAVSENDGRTWTVAAPPIAPAGVDAVWSVVASGRRLYASAGGNLSTGDYGILAIFRSDDGGRTWRRTGRSLPHLVTGDLVAAVDGSLLVSTVNGTALVSRNGGATFTPEKARFRGVASWTRYGYVTWTEPGIGIAFSSDGVHWHDLHLKS
jgi:hypothetical protein